MKLLSKVGDGGERPEYVYPCVTLCLCSLVSLSMIPGMLNHAFSLNFACLLDKG